VARPLATDDTETVEKGGWEIEFGTSYQKREEKGYKEDEHFKDIFKEIDLELVIKYGLLENCDIGLTIPYIFIDNPKEKNLDGFEDIGIGTKLRFFPFYALGLGIKTESANEDKGLGTGEVEISLNNIFTKDMERITCHLNLGYNFLTKRKEKNIFFYGFALEYPLIEQRINLVSEITGETDFDENITMGMVGFNYS